MNTTVVHQMSRELGEAAPSRHLWIGNVPPNVSEAVLKQTFSRFGVIDSVFLYSFKRYAFVNFKHQNDAENAKNKLQGTTVGGFALRIEFAKEEADSGVNASGSRVKRDVNASGGSRAKRDGEPTNVLWIGFPPNTRVEEWDLHRAFIPFAEIECITTFPDRFYAFVELRSVEEALIAKNALSGKLFNDPRFHINFSNREIGLVNKGNNSSRSFFPPVAEVGVSEVLSKTYRFSFPSNAFTMADKLNSGPKMRPPNPSMKLSGGYENMFGIGTVKGGQALGPCRGAGENPILAAHSSSFPALSLHGRAGEWTGPADVWDFPEEDFLPRDFKRARIAVTPPVERSILSSQSLNANAQHIGFTNGAVLPGGSENVPNLVNNVRLLASRSDAEIQNSGEALPRPHLSGLLSCSRPVAGVNFEAPFQPLGSVSVKKVGYLSEPRLGMVNEGWIWEGNIAKGGTFICRARCFPISIGMNVSLPEVINCTARTDLDMLGKHIFQAGDFCVVFFVPQGDVHVAPYRDFLHYLWEKHRAGVSKLGDGSSLFLVPPSDFSEKILKISRKDCLFGVVLRSQQVSTGRRELHHSQSTQQQPPTSSQVQNDARLVPQLISQPLVPQSHLHQLPVQQLATQSLGLSKELVSTSHESKENQGFTPSEGNSLLQTGMLAAIITQLTMAQSANGTLTPELIASLTALLPQTQVSSGLDLPVPAATGSGAAAATYPGSASRGDATLQTTETAVLQPVFSVGNGGVFLNVINQPLGKINPPLPPGLPPCLQQHHSSPYMNQAPQTVGGMPSFTFNSVSHSESLAQLLYGPVQKVFSSGEEPQSSHFAVVEQGQNFATTTIGTTAQAHQTSLSLPQSPVLPPTDQLAQLFQLLVQNNQQPPEISANVNVQHESSSNLLQQSRIQQPQPLPQTPYTSHTQVMQQHGTALQGGDSFQQQVLNADQGQKLTIQTEGIKDQDVEQLRFQATLQLAQTLLQQMQQQDVRVVGGAKLQ